MWGVRAAEPAGVRGLRTREYGCRRNQFSSPSIRSGDTASIQCPRVVCAHVRTFRERLRFRPTPPCPVHRECSRFPAAAVQIVGRSSSTWLSLPDPSAGSGECPLLVGSMVARSVAIWRSRSKQFNRPPKRKSHQPHDLQVFVRELNSIHVPDYPRI